jgi:hypothetical protein
LLTVKTQRDALKGIGYLQFIIYTAGRTLTIFITPKETGERTVMSFWEAL